MDNAREDREWGEAHGSAQEEHRLREGSFGWKKFRVVKKNPRQSGAQHEGCHHASERYGDRALQSALYDVDSEFHPDDEHVKRQAKLRRREEIALGVAHLLCGVPRKEPMLRLRPKQTEKRWTK